MTEFIVDGEVHELEWIDPVTGTDCARDVIGNTAHGMEMDDDGRYIATAEDLEWWESYFEASQEMSAMLKEYEDKYGYFAIDDWLYQTGAWSHDLGDQPAQVMSALRLFDEVNDND